MLVLGLVVTSLAPGCGPNSQDRFEWRDEAGHACSAICRGGAWERPTILGETCDADLACSVAPPSSLTQSCMGTYSGWGREGDHLCWSVERLGAADYDEKTLGKNLVGLCPACCRGTRLTWAAPDHRLCSPVVCDPNGLLPPEPYSCREGHVVREVAP